MCHLRIVAYTCSSLIVLGCSQTTYLDNKQVDLTQATHARTVLGLAYLERNNFEKALTNLKIAHQYLPHDLNVNLALAHYYTTVANYKQAEDYYNDMYERFPQDAKLLNNYAVFACSTKQIAKSKQLFSQALSFSSIDQRLTAHINQGLCSQKQQDYNEANYNFSQAIMIDGSNQLAYRGLIEIAHIQGHRLKQYRLLQRYEQITNHNLAAPYKGWLEELAQKYD